MVKIIIDMIYHERRKNMWTSWGFFPKIWKLSAEVHHQTNRRFISTTMNTQNILNTYRNQQDAKPIMSDKTLDELYAVWETVGAERSFEEMTMEEKENLSSGELYKLLDALEEEMADVAEELARLRWMSGEKVWADEPRRSARLKEADDKLLRSNFNKASEGKAGCPHSGPWFYKMELIGSQV